VAVLLYWLVNVLRGVTYPLQAAWFNLRIDDSQVRATLFSVGSQVDAIGQIGGGPLVGAIGNRSIRAALVASALLLTPALPLYVLARRRSG
jgi:DHA3 family tetracycline resistance protein-like MFS transporter